jgi:CubicO group peptidase (beta-lactamase class C family)
MLEGTGAYAEILSDPARRRDAETGRSIWVTKGGLISPDAPPLGPGTGRPGRVFHQTGYTGTLLWLDNEGDIALAYLTNAAATDALATFDRSAARLVMILLQGQLQ